MSFAATAAAALRTSYAHLGESVTVGGSSVTAIFEGGFVDALGAAGTGPSLRCIAADVPTVARGDAVVRGGVNYTVRSVQPMAPDELEVLLLLERS